MLLNIQRLETSPFCFATFHLYSMCYSKSLQNMMTHRTWWQNSLEAEVYMSILTSILGDYMSRLWERGRGRTRAEPCFAFSALHVRKSEDQEGGRKERQIPGYRAEARWTKSFKVDIQDQFYLIPSLHLRQLDSQGWARTGTTICFNTILFQDSAFQVQSPVIIHFVLYYEFWEKESSHGQLFVSLCVYVCEKRENTARV